MADYNTITKVIINEVSPEASDVAGSLAKEINDYIQSLDSTNNAIVDIQAVRLDRSRIAYIIVSTG
jgi:hypothetical protein|tara:strand:+ start:164 stop:361 length:198 start_codon:yes stop_codon:yes gene_type:complete